MALLEIYAVGHASRVMEEALVVVDLLILLEGLGEMISYERDRYVVHQYMVGISFAWMGEAMAKAWVCESMHDDNG
jgi:hypothetical protein